MIYLYYFIGAFLIFIVYFKVYNKETKKLNIKALSSFKLQALLVIGVLLFYYAYKEDTLNSKKVKYAKDETEARGLVIRQIRQLNEKYDDLCKKSHNDQLKKKFSDLSADIQALSVSGYECESLSYDQQISVTEFVQERIEKNPNLRALLSGKINCW
jgi:hypothetical protein